MISILYTIIFSTIIFLFFILLFSFLIKYINEVRYYGHDFETDIGILVFTILIGATSLLFLFILETGNIIT